MNPTPDNITSLGPREIFVFGSNRAGRHGAGAAKTALNWGARHGIGEGLCGHTYALPTKDENLAVLPLPEVAAGVRRFVAFARSRPDLTFLVTPIGCGLAGYQAEDIAPLFFACGQLPLNVTLPRSFQDHQP